MTKLRKPVSYIPARVDGVENAAGDGADLNGHRKASKSDPVRTSDLQAGDKARNARDWAAAGPAYARHLQLYPHDTPIWVQLGHAYKETGNHADAETAYRRAVALAPHDADAHLQLGHLLKVARRLEDASEAYAQALRLDRGSDALRELRTLGFNDEADALLASGGRKPRRCLDIGDLMMTLESHATVTGISRVQIGLLSHVFGMAADVAAAYEFVFQDGARAQAFLVPKAQVQTLLRAIRAARSDVPALVACCREKGEAVDWQAGDLYFVPGQFWTAASNPAFVAGLKAQGVRYGAYIYDLIPITHPQFCEAGLTESFMVAFAESVPFLDFVLTISAFIGQEITSFTKQNALRPIPALPAPLAHELGLGNGSVSGRAAMPPRPQSRLPDRLQGRRFVLCVGTIEARKNHVYLFYVWQRLLEEGIDVPDLVLVGQYGWRIADLRAQLQASRFLGGRIHVLNGVRDAELATLYAECLFTVFPSFVEGWGLPVGESLAWGKVPVASSTSSIPEVGGEFAVYMDPFNLHSGLDAVRRLVVDDAYRAELEAAIRDRFVPRTWQEAGAHFFAQIEAGMSGLDGGGTGAGPSGPGRAVPAGPGATIGYVPPLAAGRVLNIADLERPTDRLFDYLRRPLRLMFTEGWRPVDGGGAWIKDHAATCRFAVECPSGSEVVLLVKFAAVPWIHDNTLVIRGDGGAVPLGRDSRFEVRRVLLPGQVFWQTLRAVVGVDGAVDLQFRLEGAVRANPPDETRVLCLRMIAIGYASCGDPDERLSLMEQVACG